MKQTSDSCSKHSTFQCNTGIPIEKNDPLCETCLDYELLEIKKTDKYVTDTVIEKHSFYCDKENPNLPLYVWNNGLWENHKSEAIILEELTEIFKDEEHRSQMSLEKTTTFIKGSSLTKKLEKQPLNLISFQNGLLNLETMKLESFNQKYFTVNQIPHDYKPEIECPTWHKFLSEIILPEDLQFIQEWVGYNLYSDYPEVSFLVLIGAGQNGKTVFLDIMTALIGEKNKTNISLADLTYQEFKVAELHHKLANISDDIGNQVIKDGGNLRKITGGSMLTVQRKHAQPFDMKSYAKVTYSTNEPPEIRDKTDAMKQRLHVVDFPFKFTKNPVGEERQATERKELTEKLIDEMPGIINWALIGLKLLFENSFTFSVNRSTDDTWKFYQRKSLPVFTFIEECLEVTDDDLDKITVETMFSEMSAWLEKNKIKIQVTRNKLIKDLRDSGITTQQKRDDGRKRIYYGVKLIGDYGSTADNIQSKLHSRE